MLIMIVTICCLALAWMIFFRGFPWRRLWRDEVGGGLGTFTIPILSRGRLAQLFAEELFVAPPSWKVAAWFIDPANGRDENDGLTPATAVKTYTGGIVSRWGTTSPTLAQDTTITWLNDAPQDGSDPVVFTPTMIDAVAVLQGVVSSTNLVASGVLAGTVAKNRATGQLLKATLAASAGAGMLIKNTTAGKESIAFVYNLTAGKWEISQPLEAVVVPRDEIPFPIAVEVDTWADGDTYELYNLVRVVLVEARPLMAAPVPPNFPDPVQIYHLRGSTTDASAGGSNFTIDDDVDLLECAFDSFLVDHAVGDDLIRTMFNCAFLSGVFGLMSSSSDTRCIGGFIIQLFGGGAAWGFDFDTIIDAGAATDFSVGTTGLQAGFIVPALGAVYIKDVITPIGSVFMFRSDATGAGNHAKIWGPGTIDAKARARVGYNGVTSTAVATFLNAGGLLINGAGAANPWDAATGVWQPALALTPANLDAAFGPGGFGGHAVDPTGACIIATTSF